MFDSHDSEPLCASYQYETICGSDEKSSQSHESKSFMLSRSWLLGLVVFASAMIVLGVTTLNAEGSSIRKSSAFYDSIIGSKSTGEQVKSDEKRLDGPIISAGEQVKSDERRRDGPIISAGEQVKSDERRRDGPIISAGEQVKSDERRRDGPIISAGEQVKSDERRRDGPIISAGEQVKCERNVTMVQ